MATSPMMQGFADSEMPDDAGQPGSGQGITLCIDVAADRSLTVYKAGGDEQDAPRQPAASIGEALKMVLDLYNATGPDSGESAFKAGFSSDEPQQQRPMGRNMSRGMA